MGPERLSHLTNVADLLDLWAARLTLSESVRCRWRAAGWLHDALRDATPEQLDTWLPVEVAALEGPLRHGPAVANRLRLQGIGDRSLLAAIEHHSTGHPHLDLLGKALYLADYLEPGRGHDACRRASLRARMPDALDDVLRLVVKRRIGRVLCRGRRVHPHSVFFWNFLCHQREGIEPTVEGNGVCGHVTL